MRKVGRIFKVAGVMRDGNCRHLNAVEQVALDLDENHEPADYRKTGSNFDLPKHLLV